MVNDDPWWPEVVRRLKIAGRGPSLSDRVNPFKVPGMRRWIYVMMFNDGEIVVCPSRDPLQSKGDITVALGDLLTLRCVLLEEYRKALKEK